MFFSFLSFVFSIVRLLLSMFLLLFSFVFKNVFYMFCSFFIVCFSNFLHFSISGFDNVTPRRQNATLSQREDRRRRPKTPNLALPSPGPPSFGPVFSYVFFIFICFNIFLFFFYFIFLFIGFFRFAFCFDCFFLFSFFFDMFFIWERSNLGRKLLPSLLILPLPLPLPPSPLLPHPNPIPRKRCGWQHDLCRVLVRTGIQLQLRGAYADMTTLRRW